MTPPTPTLLRPEGTADVSRLLTGARAVAGGTDLLVQRRDGLEAPTLVDLTGLASTRPAATRDPGTGELRISAVHPLTDVAAGCAGAFPALSAAIEAFASTTIRNRATIGGNLVTGSPAADTVPALLAADAVVEIVTPDGGRRTVALADFLLGPRRVDLTAGEWVTSVRVPRPSPEGGFRKIGGRRAQAISFLNLAWQWCREPDGRLTDVRLAMGAVAPTVVRLHAAAAALEGRSPTPDVVDAAVAAVDADISPIDDLRASAHYRRRCAAGLLREALLPPSTSGGPDQHVIPTTREKDQ
ncbi:xanthine dehydrogenase family protein subunit M [Occultella glacieicola]|uniref:Xanthine dehydrogenase family protein subunit M n=1 Tax=Occultella glacieicola TaxID=2518684 RepID=A0ABY2E774_9MICO|nr:FAD binding domain-containing protein [Occultella glacieicola]TDE95908.1 xanthine dehydrogenase family protein subunit M [Occultella glacieicola]